MTTGSYCRCCVILVAKYTQAAMAKPTVNGYGCGIAVVLFFFN